MLKVGQYDFYKALALVLLSQSYEPLSGREIEAIVSVPSKYLQTRFPSWLRCGLVERVKRQRDEGCVWCYRLDNKGRRYIRRMDRAILQTYQEHIDKCKQEQVRRVIRSRFVHKLGEYICCQQGIGYWCTHTPTGDERFHKELPEGVKLVSGREYSNILNSLPKGA